MGSTKPKGSVRVRGQCSAGHVTEARSDAGRVTWEGTCSEDGCELPVKARRVPRERPENTAPAKPAPPDDDGDEPKLRKVNYGATRPKPRGKRAAAKPDGDTGNGPAADLQGAKPDGDGKPPDDGPTSGGSGEPRRRRGLFGRRGQADGSKPRSSASFKLPWED